MFTKLKSQFEEACNIFIRPPKHDYVLEELGRNPLQIKNVLVSREDLLLKNAELKSLHCSFFKIQDESLEPKPCMIYLHCNAGSRCEVLPLLSYLVTIGINVFAFDMSGCGHSEGDYVTLGYKEVFDVKMVVEFLRNNTKVSSIGIWGRSMGAVTALKYCELDPLISVVIVDSPFSNLNKLAYELAKEKTGIPHIFLPIALGLVKKGIKQRVHIKFSSLDLTKIVNKIKIPACFLFSFHDEIIKPYHVEKLFELYGCPDKKLLSIKGRHNDPRPANVMKELGKFCFDNFLKMDELFKKRVSLFETFDIYSKYSKILEKPNLDFFKKETLKEEFDLVKEENKSKITEDCEIMLLDEEMPRLMSKFSLLSQNEVKFLNNCENSSLSSKNSSDIQKKFMLENEERTNLLNCSLKVKAQQRISGILPMHSLKENCILPINDLIFEGKSSEIKVYMN